MNPKRMYAFNKFIKHAFNTRNEKISVAFESCWMIINAKKYS